MCIRDRFSPARRIQSRACSLALVLPIPRKSGPADTLSSTDFQGKIASCWKTNPVPVSIPETGLPSTNASPEEGDSRPEINVRVVDLPHPVGPTTAQNCPSSTVRLMSCSAVKVPPSAVANFLVTLRNSMAAMAITSRRCDGRHHMNEACTAAVSYTHLRAHETVLDLV